MKYAVKFPNSSLGKKFEKALSQIFQPTLQVKIMDTVEKLSDNPRPYRVKPFRKLKSPIYFYQFVAQYRLRIGDYRVLYDVDDQRKIVWVLALRKRDEETYKK